MLRYSLLLTLCLTGCAAREKVIVRPNPYWHDCQAMTVANADGFQHFSCIDLQGGRYEVLIRREPHK